MRRAGEEVPPRARSAEVAITETTPCGKMYGLPNLKLILISVLMKGHAIALLVASIGALVGIGLTIS